jgi:hypothetical protein
LSPAEYEANAAFIIRACNAHEELLTALKLARTKLAMWPEGNNPEDFPEIKAMDTAIANAEGRNPV